MDLEGVMLSEVIKMMVITTSPLSFTEFSNGVSNTVGTLSKDHFISSSHQPCEEGSRPSLHKDRKGLLRDKSLIKDKFMKAPRA